MDNIDGTNKIVKETGLTFDDVLLLPKYTQIKREEIDISSFLTQKIKLKIPILSAPMDTVSEDKLCTVLNNLGGLGVLHRNLKVEDQVEMAKKVIKETGIV